MPVTFNAGTSVMQQPGLGSKLGEMIRQIEHALLRGQYDWVVVQGNLLARIGRLEARTGRYRKTAPFRTAGPRTVAVPLKANQDRHHPGSAVGSRRVRASGNAAAQRAAIAQNPCAPKRSKIGPQASVSRAVATPMPTVP